MNTGGRKKSANTFQFHQSKNSCQGAIVSRFIRIISLFNNSVRRCVLAERNLFKIKKKILLLSFHCRAKMYWRINLKDNSVLERSTGIDLHIELIVKQ